MAISGIQALSTALTQPIAAPGRVTRVAPVSNQAGGASDPTADGDIVILSAAAAQYAQAGSTTGLTSVASAYGGQSGSVVNVTA
jgi:hypothetical protein